MQSVKSVLHVAVLVISIVCEAQAASEIVYRVTVRDFLPSWCMTPAQYAALNIVDPVLIQQPQDGPLSQCPYQSHILRGEILGHPDFQRNPHFPGWDMSFLFEVEDRLGAQSFLSGTCDQVALRSTNTRPPNLVPGFTGGDCYNFLNVYTKRFNRTKMDISPAGIPKPQFCTSDENGLCGFLVGTNPRATQSHTKFFQDMWYLDNKKYNKRIGSTLVLKAKGGNLFEFDSNNDEENPDASADAHYAPHGASKYVFPESRYPDPFLAPAWPQFSDFTNNIKNTKKFLHTSEIHTFFEYRGDEVFEFSGDDDVWVYINGITAIELGGLHPRAIQAIDLSNPRAAEYLNIVPGGIYKFDFFQAERNPTQSNAKLTTSLSSACNVALEGVGKLIFPSPKGNSFRFSRTVDFAFTNGNVFNNEDIHLLPRGSTNINSFIFSRQELNVGTGFIVEFTFVATGKPEGFTFLFHRRPDDLVNFPQSGGANLGFKGATNSVAFAFDLCMDRATGNCNEQQVGIFYPASSNDINKPSLSRRRVYDPVLISMKQGIEHSVRIEYFFRPNALELTIDDSLYLREFPFDPIASLDSLAAFGGFTGAVSESAGGISITSWSMKSVDVDSRTTIPVDFATGANANLQKVMTADGVDKNGYSIQTRDLCDSNIEFGDRSENAFGRFVEERDPETGFYAEERLEPLVLDAVIDDSGDGKYTFNLVTENIGIFSLYMAYGDSEKRCTFDVDIQPNGQVRTRLGVSLAGVVNLASNPRTTPDGCFYGVVKDGLLVLPATRSPSASPTRFEDLSGREDPTVLIVGSTFGTIFAAGICVGAVFMRVYRRKWLEEKGFIKPGEAYKLETNTVFESNDKLTRVGHELMMARVGILHTRSQRSVTKVETELNNLETEQEELVEEIRLLKRRIDLQARTVSPRPRPIPPVPSRTVHYLDF